MRRLSAPRPILLVYALVVFAIPFLAWQARHDAEVDHFKASAVPAQTDALAGIWWRFEPRAEGDDVRFYYFHGDGKGLYRYGRMGLSNTHSFDYAVDGGQLKLRFRKTGETHAIPFDLELADANGRDFLTLRSDPREGGTEIQYYRDHRGPISPHAQRDNPLGPPPAGHMWIDHRRYATGGAGFAFYQFRPAGIDGRGVGWFHRGDFDDWSTEALTYRITGERIELTFDLAQEHSITAFKVVKTAEGRELILAEDPRDFWHAHRYIDAGPSFGMALLEPDRVNDGLGTL